MELSQENKQTGQRHTNGEADGSDQRSLMNILLYKVTKKCCRHAEEENSKAECPLGCTL